MQKEDVSKKTLPGVVSKAELTFRMPWRASGIFLALLLFLLAAVVGCGEETAGSTGTDDSMADTGGRIEIAENYYDFGSVPVGETVEHTFMIKNTGSGPLKLGEVDIIKLEGC